jgi:hypothetical protein
MLEGERVATIVHRRPMRVPARELRGPGASLSALSWVGWVSVVAAAAWFVLSMRPLLDTGDAQTWSWGGVARLAWSGLSDAVVIGLPAALEWGVPDARRRTPLLLRATVLLALQVVGGGALILARTWLAEATDLGLDFGSPVGLSLTMLQLGTVVIGIGGVWALSDGLIDAGARIGRRLLVAATVTGVILGTWLVPFLLPLNELGAAVGQPLFWLNLASLFLYTVDTVLWCIVAVRLIVGFRVGQRPRRAWAIGMFAGVVSIAARLGSMLLVLGGLQDVWASVVAALLYGAPWILLLLALLAGLGRGRERRDAPPSRMHLFILNPTA